MRRENDFYETPAWCVDRLLEYIVDQNSFDMLDLGRSERWLDPAVGTGALPRAVGKHCDWVDWTTMDIDPKREATCHGDFLKVKVSPNTYDVCFMNPPYSQAEAFVRKALSCSANVFALMRLAWISSAKHHQFFRENMPDVYVLPNRPSFTGDGKSDSADYAWFVWWESADRRHYRGIHLLDTTPVSERRVRNAAG